MNFKFPLLLSAALALALPTFAQDAPRLAESQVARRANALARFAPRGWKIEKTIRGDLNRDKISDAALVLVENKPAKDAQGDAMARSRALVVLLKEGKGWRRAGFNNSLLLGTRDGGALYGVMETPVNVSIKNGVLNVNQDNGSREVTDTTHKFRLDKRTRRFYLIGFEISQSDRAGGLSQQESLNFLTGKKEIVISSLGIIGNSPTPKIKKYPPVSRKLRTLESIKVEERYSG